MAERHLAQQRERAVQDAAIVVAGDHQVSHVADTHELHVIGIVTRVRREYSAGRCAATAGASPEHDCRFLRKRHFPPAAVGPACHAGRAPSRSPRPPTGPSSPSTTTTAGMVSRYRVRGRLREGRVPQPGVGPGFGIDGARVHDDYQRTQRVAHDTCRTLCMRQLYGVRRRISRDGAAEEVSTWLLEQRP